MHDTSPNRLLAATHMLDELQATLEREIPMCAQMGIRVHEGGVDGLVMRLPLDPNRNHQQTAFAGSLNALCTIAGWGYVFLLLRELGRSGNIVIRRSNDQISAAGDVVGNLRPLPAGSAEESAILSRDARRQRAVEAGTRRRSGRLRRSGRFVQRLVRRVAERQLSAGAIAQTTAAM